MPIISSNIIHNLDELKEKKSDFWKFLQQNKVNNKITNFSFPVDLKEKKYFSPMFGGISLDQETFDGPNFKGIINDLNVKGTINPDKKCLAFQYMQCKLNPKEHKLIEEQISEYDETFNHISFSLNQLKKACDQSEYLYCDLYGSFGGIYAEREKAKQYHAKTINSESVKQIACENYENLSQNIIKYIEEKGFKVTQSMEENIENVMIPNVVEELKNSKDTNAVKNEFIAELETLNDALTTGNNWQAFNALLQNRGIKFDLPAVQEPENEGNLLIEQYAQYEKTLLQTNKQEGQINSNNTSASYNTVANIGKLEENKKDFIKYNIENVSQNALKAPNSKNGANPLQMHPSLR